MTVFGAQARPAKGIATKCDTPGGPWSRVRSHVAWGVAARLGDSSCRVIAFGLTSATVEPSASSPGLSRGPWFPLVPRLVPGTSPGMTVFGAQARPAKSIATKCDIPGGPWSRVRSHVAWGVAAGLGCGSCRVIAFGLTSAIVEPSASSPGMTVFWRPSPSSKGIATKCDTPGGPWSRVRAHVAWGVSAGLGCGSCLGVHSHVVWGVATGLGRGPWSRVRSHVVWGIAGDLCGVSRCRWHFHGA